MSVSLEELVARLAAATVDGRNAESTLLRAQLQTALSRALPGPIERNWPSVPAVDLPDRPGVYVISSTTSDEHYVGLALDIHFRFWNERYGHLSQRNKARSQRLIDRGDFAVSLPFLLPRDEPGQTDRFELSRREIQTYVEITAGGGRVVNSLALLGRVGQSRGSPVIVVDCATGLYTFADSTAAARRFAKSTAMYPVLHGYQRTAGGYTARWATPNEAEQLVDDVDAAGFVKGAKVMELVVSDPSRVEWNGVGRASTFRWISGPLSAIDRERLLRYSRQAYVKPPGPRLPRFHGVSWDRREEKWQCRAKTGPGPKDLWQIGSRQWSELEAAATREEKVRAERWERFNSGRYASNAAQLNEELGEARFTGW